MDLSTMAVYSAMSAAEQALEYNAQDLANVNTPGYRPQMPYFQSAGTASVGEDENTTQLPWGVQLEPGAPSDKPGPLHAVDNGLAAALSAPDDYFAVQTAQGVAYTRDGDFHLDPQGNLVDVSGDPVLGVDGPLNVAGGRAMLGPDGGLYGMNADGTFGNGTPAAGTLLVTNLKGLELERLGSQMFVPATGQAGLPGQGRVLPGQLEGSGSDTFKGMADLVVLMRWSQSLEKAAQASDQAEDGLLEAAKLNA